MYTIHISWLRSFRSSLTPVLRHCKWSAGAKMWGTKHGAIPLPLKVKKDAPALWVPPTLSKGAGSSVLSSSGPCADRCPCSGLLGSLPQSCLPSWEASFNPAAYASRWPKIPSCSQGKKNAPWWSSQGISAGWDLSRRDQTRNRSSLWMTGAAHLSTARMLRALLWQQCPLCLPCSMWDHSCTSSCVPVLVPSVCTHVSAGACECQAPTWQQIGGRSQRLTNSFPGRAWLGEGTSALCQPTQFHPVPAWVSQTS